MKLAKEINNKIFLKIKKAKKKYMLNHIKIEIIY